MKAILSFLPDIFYHFITDLPYTEDGKMEGTSKNLGEQWVQMCVECKLSTKPAFFG